MTWSFDGNGNLFEGFVPANRVTGFYESVANTFNQSLGHNGFIRMPNGLIIQWGHVYYLGATAAQGSVFSFYTAFPNACLSIVTSDDGSSANITAAAPVTASQFTCWVKLYNGRYIDSAIYYIAIGF